jgi:hypothetical protein
MQQQRSHMLGVDCQDARAPQDQGGQVGAHQHVRAVSCVALPQAGRRAGGSSKVPCEMCQSVDVMNIRTSVACWLIAQRLQGRILLHAKQRHD